MYSARATKGWQYTFKDLDYARKIHSPVGMKTWKDFRYLYRRCPSASTLSAGFGVGYGTLNAAVRKHIESPDVSEQRELDISDFATRAMLHGTENEDEAKKQYLKFYPEFEHVRHDSTEEITDVISITRTAKGENKENIQPETTRVIVTPDLIATDNKSGERIVVEFKCPFFEIFQPNRRHNRTIALICEEFTEKNPYGKTNSFIQSAVYCFVYGLKKFRTVYYFTDGEDASMAVFTYTINDHLMDTLFDAIKEMTTYIERVEDNDEKLVHKQKSSRMRLAKVLMNDCWEDTAYYNLDNESDESETLGSDTMSEGEPFPWEEDSEIEGESLLFR